LVEVIRCYLLKYSESTEWTRSALLGG